MDMHSLQTKRPIDENISAFVGDEYCDIPNPTNSIIDVKHIPSISALVTSGAGWGLCFLQSLDSSPDLHVLLVVAGVDVGRVVFRFLGVAVRSSISNS